MSQNSSLVGIDRCPFICLLGLLDILSRITYLFYYLTLYIDMGGFMYYYLIIIFHRIFMKISQTSSIQKSKKRRPIFQHKENSPVRSFEISAYNNQTSNQQNQQYFLSNNTIVKSSMLAYKNPQVIGSSIHQIYRSPTPTMINFSQPKTNRNPLAHIEFQRQSGRPTNFIHNRTISQIQSHPPQQQLTHKPVQIKQNSLLQLPNYYHQPNRNVSPIPLRPSSSINYANLNQQRKINMEPRQISTGKYFNQNPQINILQKGIPYNNQTLPQNATYYLKSSAIQKFHSIAPQQPSKDINHSSFYKPSLDNKQMIQQQSPNIIITPPPHSDFTIIRKIQADIVPIERIGKPLQQNNIQPPSSFKFNNCPSMVTRYMDEQSSFIIQKKLSTVGGLQKYQQIQSHQEIPNQNQKIQQLTQINALLSENYKILYKQFFDRKQERPQQEIDQKGWVKKSINQIQTIFHVETKKRLDQIQQIYRNSKKLQKKGAQTRMKF